MKKTTKLQNLQLKAATIRQLTTELEKVTGGRVNDETRVASCSCQNVCNVGETDICP